jgi:hypothetical protein
MELEKAAWKPDDEHDKHAFPGLRPLPSPRKLSEQDVETHVWKRWDGVFKRLVESGD